MHTVIFTGGRLRDGAPVRRALADADSVIAADSGALSALSMGVTPSAVIGDFDSLSPKHRADLKAKGAELIAYPADKDRADTELAIDHALKAGSKRITVLGGTEGSRIDHILANVLAASDREVSVRFVSGSATVWQARGPGNELIKGAAGDTVSLIPLTQRVTGITNSGMKYALKDDALKMDQARGVSNVMTRKQASVAWARGRLLFVHDESPV